MQPKIHGKIIQMATGHHQPVLFSFTAKHSKCISTNFHVNRLYPYPYIPISVLGGSSHLVSGLVHFRYKWTNPTYPIYNQGCNHIIPYHAISICSHEFPRRITWKIQPNFVFRRAVLRSLQERSF